MTTTHYALIVIATSKELAVSPPSQALSCEVARLTGRNDTIAITSWTCTNNTDPISISAFDLRRRIDSASQFLHNIISTTLYPGQSK
jgi:hypothetical protein